MGRRRVAAAVLAALVLTGCGSPSAPAPEAGGSPSESAPEAGAVEGGDVLACEQREEVSIDIEGGSEGEPSPEEAIDSFPASMGLPGTRGEQVGDLRWHMVDSDGVVVAVVTTEEIPSTGGWYVESFEKCAGS